MRCPIICRRLSTSAWPHTSILKQQEEKSWKHIQHWPFPHQWPARARKREVKNFLVGDFKWSKKSRRKSETKAWNVNHSEQKKNGKQMRVNEELFHFYLFTVSLSFTLAWPRIAQSVKHKEAIKIFILLETNQIMKKKKLISTFLRQNWIREKTITILEMWRND